MSILPAVFVNSIIQSKLKEFSMKYHRTSFALLAAVMLLTISACSSATPTEPPTSTPEPIPPTATLEPTPAAIPATQDVIQVGAFQFHIVRKTYDDTFVGFAPGGMGSDRILIIEVELISGDEAGFVALAPEIVLGSGEVRQPIAFIVGESVLTNTSLSLVSQDFWYRRTEGTTVLAYVAPEDPGQITLEFSSGEIIDLTPLYE
jgi:hypothetical protein